MSDSKLAVRPGMIPATKRSARERRVARSIRLPYALNRIDLILAAVIAGVFLIVALFPGLATGLDPNLADPRVSLQAPGAAHWFGTDELGRDLFSRVVHGASLSLGAALFAVAFSFVVGSALGIIAGTAGSWVDAVVMRVLDAVLAIPSLLLVFAILAVMGNGVMNIALAIGIAGTVSFARVMRAEVISVRTSTFVEAASAMGVKPFGIVVRHIIPNSVSPLIALAALEFGTSLLTIGAMGYLGFGAEPPNAEWGALIADGQKYIRIAWWLGVLPGVVFVAVVLSVNRLSRALGEGNRSHV